MTSSILTLPFSGAANGIVGNPEKLASRAPVDAIVRLAIYAVAQHSANIPF
jgi:hypothetical protein